MALSSTSASTNNNANPIYNYSYISHDSTGCKQSYEAIKGLEEFYLLFNPPPATTTEATQATAPHLSSATKITTPVVEFTTHLNSVDSSSGNPTHPSSTKEIDTPVVEAKTAAIKAPTIAVPHRSSTTKIDDPFDESIPTVTPNYPAIDPPVVKSIATGIPWSPQESGLCYFDLIEPPPIEGAQKQIRSNACQHQPQSQPSSTNHNHNHLRMPSCCTRRCDHFVVCCC